MAGSQRSVLRGGEAVAGDEASAKAGHARTGRARGQWPDDLEPPTLGYRGPNLITRLGVVVFFLHVGPAPATKRPSQPRSFFHMIRYQLGRVVGDLRQRERPSRPVGDPGS